MGKKNILTPLVKVKKNNNKSKEAANAFKEDLTQDEKY